MSRKYSLLEQYLRNLIPSQNEVTLTFECMEQILKSHLPRSAFQDRTWWESPKHGKAVQTIAGWVVDAFDLDQKWVRFVRNQMQ